MRAAAQRVRVCRLGEEYSQRRKQLKTQSQKHLEAKTPPEIPPEGMTLNPKPYRVCKLILVSLLRCQESRDNRSSWKHQKARQAGTGVV